MMKSVYSIIICAVLFMFSGAALAQSYDQAVAAWLDGDDATALASLSQLAREGNRDAQVLLGAIAERPHGAYVQSLNRKQRIALLRSPGGLSGKSWHKVAAQNGDALAKVLDMTGTEIKAEHIKILMDYQQDREAITNVSRLRNNGDFDELALLYQHKTNSDPIKFELNYTLSLFKNHPEYKQISPALAAEPYLEFNESGLYALAFRLLQIGKRGAFLTQTEAQLKTAMIGGYVHDYVKARPVVAKMLNHHLGGGPEAQVFAAVRASLPRVCVAVCP